MRLCAPEDTERMKIPPISAKFPLLTEFYQAMPTLRPQRLASMMLLCGS